ncbi:exodeoxyribonuclease VII small subunit [Desulfosporosinus meridiei]|uniref:Exodeoxyribonuclease 7 small subunit n=1 Tax=Desulfosporosinus meridiei (strain ATCC BAA-275 / DSM 13257 / KCTC 12902 / NCIMB 13706 / S10) TaxID=768704 RepID=J7IMM4_DESMD|nr:exodeoxyribonuclease VII small subunit [Desulfosporosinus meridiei]AFQ43057.1 Exodeoxyribonuclease VII small subunit [Desulfosporosinus meridiei DSM 13257]
MSIDIETGDLFNLGHDKVEENTADEPKSLEMGLQSLEEIVRTLEQKDLPLEKALNLFKDGVGLVQYCSQVLDQAEKQMEILLEGSDGQLQIKPASFDGKDER